MATSRVPIFGLPHKVDIIRKVAADDGAGGLDPDGGTPVVLYSNQKSRVTTLNSGDLEKLASHGFSAANHRKVISRYCPKVQRNDFVQIPWGVPPNVVSPAGTADGMAPQVTINTPTGVATLIWSDSDSKYESGVYSVLWTGVVWRFQDTDAPVTHDFTGFTQDQNIFKRDWRTEVGASYSVVTETDSDQDYRIVWYQHQIDDFGHSHHTSLVIELESPDT
jgi:hypothetical protein